MKTWIIIALRNIRLHWKHSLAAVISIATGFISLCLFQGYMDDVAKVYFETYSDAKMFGDIIVEHKLFQSVEGKSHPLLYAINLDDQKKIEKFLTSQSQSIVSQVRFLNVSGMISNGNQETIFIGRGYDLDTGKIMRGPVWAWDTMYGLPLDHSEAKPLSIVIGFTLGHLLGCVEEMSGNINAPTGGFKPEYRPFKCQSNDMQLTVVTESGQINANDVVVNGLIDANYKEVDNKYIQLSLETAQSLMNTNKVSYYTIRLKNASNTLKFIDEFNHYAKSNNLNLDIKHWTNHLIGDMYNRSMQWLMLFRNFIITVILAIACLSIFNTMMKIIRERTREIGTLRSLGFGRKDVTSIFMYEAFFLGVFGVGAGCVASLVSTSVINFLGIAYKAGILTQPVVFKIKGSFFLYGISFTILMSVTLVTAYLATRRVTKKKIIENLTQA